MYNYLVSARPLQYSDIKRREELIPYAAEILYIVSWHCIVIWLVFFIPVTSLNSWLILGNESGTFRNNCQTQEHLMNSDL